MFNKSDLVNRLIEEEGLRLKPYTDTVGKLTIGIGRNLTDVGISENEAHYLLDNDIDKVITQLRANLNYFDSLPNNIQLALTDLAFNMGIGGLLSFHNTLKYVEIGDYKFASENLLLSKWAKQVGRTRSLSIANLIKNA